MPLPLWWHRFGLGLSFVSAALEKKNFKLPPCWFVLLPDWQQLLCSAIREGYISHGALCLPSCLWGCNDKCGPPMSALAWLVSKEIPQLQCRCALVYVHMLALWPVRLAFENLKRSLWQFFLRKAKWKQSFSYFTLLLIFVKALVNLFISTCLDPFLYERVAGLERTN